MDPLSGGAARPALRGLGAGGEPSVLGAFGLAGDGGLAAGGPWSADHGVAGFGLVGGGGV